MPVPLLTGWFMNAERIDVQPVEGARVVLAPGAILVRVRDGSARLLHLDGAFSALSPTAADMLGRALTSHVGAVACDLARACGVSIEEVAADLDGLLSALGRQGYLARRADRRAGGVARLLDAGISRLVYRVCRRSGHTRAGAFALLSLACVSFCILGWTRTIAAWDAGVAAGTEDRGGADVAAVADEVDVLVSAAAACHPGPVACKERALVGWALLRGEGLPARMVLGVDIYPFRSHCWCALGGRIIADHADRCEAYTEVWSHHGRAIALGRS